MATADHNRFEETVARESISLSDLPLLVCRADAAAILGLPLRTFDKHVRPLLNARRIGRMVMFEKGEIIRWAKGKESAEGSISARIHETESTYAVSTSAGSKRSSRREREILERLRSERRSSTPKR
jgi:hypothetical protein